MTSILDRAVAHFSQQQHVDVPEWGEAGKPLRIFFKAESVAEQEKRLRMSKAAEENQGEALLRMIVARALDGDGKPMFDIGALPLLADQADAQVMARIAMAMTQSMTVESAVKN